MSVTVSHWKNLHKTLPVNRDYTGDDSQVDSLILSPTSLQTWMDCPRRFYYRHRLGIRDTTSPAAHMGLLVHGLMELFHKIIPVAEHTMASLKALAAQLFELDAPFVPNFPQSDIRKTADGLRSGLMALDPVAREDLKNRLFAALEDMNAKRFFVWPAGHRLVRVLAEERLPAMTIDGIEGCLWTMQPDVLLELEAPNGERYWQVWDYKFYQPNAFAGTLRTRDRRLQNVLTPLPEDPVDEHGEVTRLPHAKRFAQSEAKPRLYQLPLLYWRLQQDERFKGRIEQLALKIIRPPFHNNPEQGSVTVELPVEQLEAATDAMKADLQTCGVDVIRNTQRFEPIAGRQCFSCEYRSICDAGQTQADSEEE